MINVFNVDNFVLLLFCLNVCYEYSCYYRIINIHEVIGYTVIKIAYLLALL